VTDLKVVAIGDCVRAVESWNPLKAAGEDEFTYIDLSAIDQERKQIVEARIVACVEAPSRARQLVEAGDVLVSTVRPNLNGVARVGVEHHGATASTGFCVLRPKAEMLDGGYAFQWVKSPGFVADMVSRATGASYPAVSDRIIFDSRVPLPPLPEQRRIAAILDQADALRVKRREALAQLDSLTQAIFMEMFGDPVLNDRAWPTDKVSNLCRLVRGSSPRPQGDPRYFGGPVPRLMIADITRDGWLVTPRIDSLTIEGAAKSRPVPAGTVVMAVSGNIGLVSRLAVDACVHDGFVAFTNLDEKVCDARYFLALLHMSKAAHEKSKAGAIFINVTTDDIKAMSIPTPPIALQRSFVARLQTVESLRATHRAALAESDALFASLQHRAFSGQLS
jgi:type I restriction enzyme, S subunit